MSKDPKLTATPIIIGLLVGQLWINLRQNEKISLWSRAFQLIATQNKLIMTAKNQLPDTCVDELDRRVLSLMKKMP